MQEMKRCKCKYSNRLQGSRLQRNHMARVLQFKVVMKVAIPTWGGRISPVFDVAKRLLVVDVECSTEVGREDKVIEETDPGLRARRLAQLGVNVLICGAVSLPLEAMLVSAGVHLILHVCGPVEEVLQAFVSGRLTDQMFLMPGCCGRRRRVRGRRRGEGRRLEKWGDTA